MSEERITSKRPPFWMIWANPIVRRYARSRLRPAGLGVWALIVLLIAGFMFFGIRGAALNSDRMELIDAARLPLFPLGILQMIVLFFLGTGQVAGAMTAEADEGVIDYQRLAPMTPLSKVVGYLFGLPIREWILFWLTMPFSIISLWQGEVPLKIAVQCYAVFIGAAVLYHLTGLLAGTVMKNRRWAFLSSMGLVFVLYTVLPYAAKFGLVYFKYFTIMPVIEESLSHLIPRRGGAAVETYQNFVPTAKFFGLDFPQAAFTLLSMGVLSLVMMTMLWRRWRRRESHLMGKVGAVGLFGWIQLVLYGNALPLIETGDFFPSRELNRRFGQFFNDRGGWTPEPSEATFLIGLFGFMTVLMLWWMTLLITANHEGQVRGWRRARKLGLRRLPPWSDPATGVPWVLLMAGMGAWGWHSFATALMDSRWFPGYDLPGWSFVGFAMVLLTAGLGFSALLEGKGKKATGLTVILGGVLPVMVGTVVGVSFSEKFIALSVWLIGICPAGWPIYASAVIAPPDDMPLELSRSVPNAFWFWQGVAGLLVLWLLAGLWKVRKAVAEGTKE